VCGHRLFLGGPKYQTKLARQTDEHEVQTEDVILLIFGDAVGGQEK
jgi:hypothetical protein